MKRSPQHRCVCACGADSVALVTCKIDQLPLLHVSCQCAHECFLDCCVGVCERMNIFGVLQICVSKLAPDHPHLVSLHMPNQTCLSFQWLPWITWSTHCVPSKGVYNVQADTCLCLKGKRGQIVPANAKQIRQRSLPQCKCPSITVNFRVIVQNGKWHNIMASGVTNGKWCDVIANGLHRRYVQAQHRLQCKPGHN